MTKAALWYYWLRRPVRYVFKHTLLVTKRMTSDSNIRSGFWEALKSAPSILLDREVVPPFIEEQIRKIESFYELLAR